MLQIATTVSMPSRACNSFLRCVPRGWRSSCVWNVSMPSRACNSFLLYQRRRKRPSFIMCQCPLGLVTHFYFLDIEFVGTDHGDMCQCPLGLVTHFYPRYVLPGVWHNVAVSMPSRACNSFLHYKVVSLFGREGSMCQCPLGLVTHFYQKWVS